MNKKKIFSFLRAHPASTRKDISHQLRLSFGTVATICLELIEEGLIESVSSATSQGGRIPDLVSLKVDSRYIVCLDLIQKNQAMLALCNLEGKMCSSITWDTTGFRDFDSLKHSIVNHYKSLLTDAAIQSHWVIGMGGAIPAIQSYDQGLIIHSTNPLLENTHLVAELESALGCTVVVENESNLLAMAITGFGYQTETVGDIVYLYISEGLGAGIICNEKLLLGTRRLGGEVNHLPLGKRGYRCYCGNDNCVETELSVAGFLRKYREDSGIDLGHGSGAWSRFENLIREQDRTAIGIAQENAQVLGCLIASLCNLFDPEKVFIGGVVDEIFTSMEEVLLQEYKKRLVVPQLGHCSIVQSPVSSGLLLRGCVESVVMQWVPGSLPRELKSE